MSIGHIYIYGEIGNYQSKDAQDYGVVSLKNVVESINSQRDAEEYHVHIHSIGGEIVEGLAIYNALKSTGKKITTINEGACYSIATVIFMAGDVRLASEHTDFVIHNEWGGAFGSADDMRKVADELEVYRNKIVQVYIDNGVNITSEDLKEIMLEDRLMNIEEAKKLNFVTEIKSTLKAVAKFKINNKQKQKQMSKTESKFVKELKNILGIEKKDTPKNVKVSTADLGELDFYELEDGEVPKVGDKAKLGDSDADGEVLLQDGTVYVFTAGELTEIKEKEESDSEEVENLKKEIEDLKTKLSENATNFENKTVEFEAINKELEAVNLTIDNLKNLVSKNVIKTKKEISKKEPVIEKSSMSNALDAVINLKNKK